MSFMLVVSCDKEDDCDCYYSEEFDQYFPDERFEKAWIENYSPERGPQDRLDALAAECRVKGC